MAVVVYIDGAIHGEKDATISVFDRGFLYGDSVYEVLRTAGGRPVDLDDHLARLARSAAAIALPLPEPAALREAIARTLAAADHPDSYIRIVVTRGAGEVSLDIAMARDPSTIIIARPLALPPAELYRAGASLWVVGVQRT